MVMVSRATAGRVRLNARENGQISPRSCVRAAKLLVAIHALRQSCSKAGKARIFHANLGAIRGIPDNLS